MIMSLFLNGVPVYHIHDIQIAPQYSTFVAGHWLLGLHRPSRAAVSRI